MPGVRVGHDTAKPDRAAAASSVMDAARPAERISELAALDGPANWLADLSARQRGAAADLARGKPLGHAVHPALTDLPIGFWTSAVALDLLGAGRYAKAARALVGLGVLSALPTAVAGLADLPTMERAKRRVAIIHAVSNLIATALYARSWSARARGRNVAGFALGALGGAVATLGGYLGGWMAFGKTPEKPDAESARPSGDHSDERAVLIGAAD